MTCTAISSTKKKSMRAVLGDLYKEAWDSWPERVWKSDNQSVVLVQTDIRQEKNSKDTRNDAMCLE